MAEVLGQVVSDRTESEIQIFRASNSINSSGDAVAVGVCQHPSAKWRRGYHTREKEGWGVSWGYISIGSLGAVAWMEHSCQGQGKEGPRRDLQETVALCWRRMVPSVLSLLALHLPILD